jgi:hypothetical protein
MSVDEGKRKEGVLPRPHDVGGAANTDPIDRSERPQADWELLADAMHQLLVAKKLRRHDQLRRAIESLDQSTYDRLTYFERRAWASEALLVEGGILTHQEVDEAVERIAGVWSG